MFWIKTSALTMFTPLYKRKKLIASLSIIIFIASLLTGKTISASTPSNPSPVLMATLVPSPGTSPTSFTDSDETVTAAFAGISPEERNVYLVAKGMDGSIYYRSYDTVAGMWGDWKVVLGGSTVDTPAVTVIDDKLFMVVRGSDANSLWFGTVDLTDDSFSGWSFISTPTPTPVPTPTPTSSPTPTPVPTATPSDELKLAAYDEPPSLPSAHLLNSINCDDFGSLSPGQSRSYIAYFRNEGDISFKLYMSTSDWEFKDNAGYLLSENYKQYFTVTWNYDNSTIAPGEIRAISFTLAVSSNLVDVSTFSFNIVVIAAH